MEDKDKAYLDAYYEQCRHDEELLEARSAQEFAVGNICGVWIKGKDVRGNAMPHILAKATVENAASVQFDDGFLRGHETQRLTVRLDSLNPLIVLPEQSLEFYGFDNKIMRFSEFEEIDQYELAEGARDYYSSLPRKPFVFFGILERVPRDDCQLGDSVGKGCTIELFPRSHYIYEWGAQVTLCGAPDGGRYPSGIRIPWDRRVVYDVDMLELGGYRWNNVVLLPGNTTYLRALYNTKTVVDETRFVEHPTPLFKSGDRVRYFESGTRRKRVGVIEAARTNKGISNARGVNYSVWVEGEDLPVEFPEWRLSPKYTQCLKPSISPFASFHEASRMRHRIFANAAYDNDYIFSIRRLDWRDWDGPGRLAPPGLLADIPYFDVEEGAVGNLLRGPLRAFISQGIAMNQYSKNDSNKVIFVPYEKNYYTIEDFELVLYAVEKMKAYLEHSCMMLDYEAIESPSVCFGGHLVKALSWPAGVTRAIDFYGRFIRCMRKMIDAFTTSRGDAAKEFPYVVCVELHHSFMW